jgi:hypothetical protein
VIEPQLSERAVAFRSKIIEALRGFEYVDADQCAAQCPVCGGILSVRFHGLAARADLDCLEGCSEAEILSALGPRSRARS